MRVMNMFYTNWQPMYQRGQMDQPIFMDVPVNRGAGANPFGDMLQLYQMYQATRTPAFTQEQANPMLDGASYSSVDQMSPAAALDPFQRGNLYQTQGSLNPMFTGQPAYQNQSYSYTPYRNRFY